MSAFEELGVMPEIITALEEMDWSLPTPVQTETIPLILGGGDVAVAAETGSGKTGAFCLPIVQIVFESRRTNLESENEQVLSVPDDDSKSIALSKNDRGRTVAVDDVGAVAQCRHPVIWDGLRATRAVAHGKWYFVARMRDEGIGRVGWSSRYASLILGTDARGFGYGGTAMKSHGSKFDSYGVKYGNGDAICCMVEYAQSESLEDADVIISFMKNDSPLGTAFSTSFAQLGLPNLPLFPALAMKNAEIAVDFAESSAKAEQLGFRPMREAQPADKAVPAEVESLFKSSKVLSDGGKSKGENHNRSGQEPLALILEPSRELAGQVHEEVTKFRKYLPKDTARVVLLTGGRSSKSEKGLLRDGCDIVAGTLGSVVNLVKRGTLSLSNIRFFVLDEADTFATDNLGDVEFLHKKVPLRNRVQTMLFSATLHSSEIRQLSEKIQSFPTWVDLKGKESVPDTVHHTMMRIDANADGGLLDEVPKHICWPLDKVHDKGTLKQNDGDAEMEDAADERSHLIKKLKLAALVKTIDAHEMSQAMIFVRTQLDGDNVESYLLQCSGVPADQVNARRFKGRRGVGPEATYSCAVLHGGRQQQERNDALAVFKAGEVRFLVCTDVAARGIDVVGLPYLINVSLPDKAENYIHRVGRVGRAERLGLAVSLVAEQKEAVWYHTCGKPKNGVCGNRSLVSVGGCVMWQNEPKMLEEIEARLKGRIEELGSDYRRKDNSAAPILYGARAGEEEVFAITAKHVELLQPAVRQLVRMEEDAQMSFFALQAQYSV